MKRREFITLLGGAASWPLAARAQQGERVRRIGWLTGIADDSMTQARLATFLETLQRLGWTEGQNVQVDRRWGGGDADRIRKYAAELATSTRMYSWPLVPPPRSSCFGPPAPCQSYLCSSPIQSAPASSRVCRDRAAMRPALCSSNMV